ncbi:unnamed protein product [Laminaria digitata]
MGSRWQWVSAALVVGTLAMAPTLGRAAPPERVVSINLCADQLLVLLADREVLLSVTFLSTQPSQSFVANRVGNIPRNYGEAEEILAMQPDLVVAGRFAARPAVRMLERFGVPVLDLPIPESFDQIRNQITLVSSALGVEARGDAMIAEMNRRLIEARPRRDTPRRALVVGARGFTSGSETLVDEILSAAGLANVASELGIRGFGRIDLEEIVAADPDVIIMNQAQNTRPSLARETLEHPALRHFGGQIVHMNPALWTCGGPFTVEAVEFLAQAVP